MDRFSQLEFGEKKPEGNHSGGEPVRDAGYFLKVALKYWLAGDFEVALRNYSRVLEQNNLEIEGWLGQVWMLIELGEYREAQVWTDKALKLFPEHSELLAARAVACSRDAEPERALAYSDNSISKDEVTPRVWLARAEVLISRKSNVMEGCISKAISSAGRKAAIIKLEAARLLRRKGNYSGAMGYLKEVVETFPKSALAWYELGSCQASLGLTQAKATLEQALQFHPDWAEAKAALNKCKKSGFLGKLFGK